MVSVLAGPDSPQRHREHKGSEWTLIWHQVDGERAVTELQIPKLRTPISNPGRVSILVIRNIVVSHRSARDPLFRQRWFTDEVIVTSSALVACVSSASYCDQELLQPDETTRFRTALFEDGPSASRWSSFY